MYRIPVKQVSKNFGGWHCTHRGRYYSRSLLCDTHTHLSSTAFSSSLASTIEGPSSEWVTSPPRIFGKMVVAGVAVAGVGVPFETACSYNSTLFCKMCIIPTWG